VPVVLGVIGCAARWAGPASENINFAFGIPEGYASIGGPVAWVEGWGSWVRWHGLYLVYNAILFTLCGALLQRVLSWVGFGGCGEVLVTEHGDV